MYIRTHQALQSFVEQIRGTPRLAIDTEFVRERQYYPQLEIIQVATPEGEAILDYRALKRLEPFTELLTDPATLKIFHAASQDLEIFFNLTKGVPAPLFDTQVAAAMVGLGPQVGYSRLVESLLGVTLHKTETLTDWSRRPLSEAQLAYALDDVRYLLPIHSLLQERLDEMGRSDWLKDEWDAMTNPDAYRRVHPRDAYRRVTGMNRLRPHELAILREVAEWREREAVRRDRAAPLVIRDHVLIEVTRRAPQSKEALAEIRSLHSRELDQYSEELLAAIQRGKRLPRGEWPRLPERVTLSGPESSLVALMQAWLRARADEVNIAPNYLSTAAELQELVAASPEERADLAVLRGWRRRLLGADLLALVEGRAALAWEPTTHRLKLIYPETGEA